MTIEIKLFAVDTLIYILFVPCFGVDDLCFSSYVRTHIFSKFQVTVPE